MQSARGSAESAVLHDLGEGEEIVEMTHWENFAVLLLETIRSRWRI
jgi:hypothetical protein